MNLTLYVWRQNDAHSPGGMVRYEAEGISPDMTFLEMLDVMNWNLTVKGEEPIAFDASLRLFCASCVRVETARRSASSARIALETGSIPRLASAASKA